MFSAVSWTIFEIRIKSSGEHVVKLTQPALPSREAFRLNGHCCAQSIVAIHER